MAVHVRIPTPLRRITNGERVVQAEGGDLAQAIDDLDRRYPGLRAKILDDRGEVLQFVNIFVNERDIRFLSGVRTPLEEGAEVSIVPAMAGGSTTVSLSIASIRELRDRLTECRPVPQ